MKTERITGHVPPPIRSAASKAAADSCVSESRIVEWALRAWLEAHGYLPALKEASR